MLQPSVEKRLAQLRKPVEFLAQAFAASGYSLYLVGGPVRDAILDIEVSDWDFTTSARPDEILAVVKPIASAVWEVGKEFGTIGAQFAQLGAEKVEITTYRSDVYTPESRKPEVQFGDSLEGDLLRRDFRINAMALDILTGEIIDPFLGLQDLKAGVLNTPASARESFNEDPLRMLRAARFSSQLSVLPTPDVVAAMQQLASRMEIISAERKRDELTKLLLTNNPRDGLDLLTKTGVAKYVLPELPALQMERDEHNRHKDVYQHTLTVLEQSMDLEKRRGHKPDLIGRLAAIMHDVGKPKTRRFEPGGKVSFHHHDVVGAKMTRKRLAALRFPKEVVEAVSLLVELHLRFHGYADAEWSDSAVRRYVRDAGAQLERLHILTQADCTTRNQRKANRLRTAYEQLEWRIEELAKAEELAAIRPDLDGAEIMEILGIKPGPVVGKAYKFLLDLRLDEGPLDKANAKARLLAWWETTKTDS